MEIWIILLFFSAAGSAALIVRNLSRLHYLYRNEKKSDVKTQPFFSEAEQYIVIPIKNFWEGNFIPFLYKEIEKISRQFRIYVLKLENKLFKFNSYIRGKRIIKENGTSSEYLQKLNGFKENGGVNNGEVKND